MHNVVGQEGEKKEQGARASACAKQYDLRVMKLQPGPHGYNQRNQRELSTLSVIMDHLALGRHKQAADVTAARLKAVEMSNREGHFQNAQYLELLPVNTEGLTTADEKHMVRNEVLLNKKEWASSETGWPKSGKGKPENYTWQPQGKGKGEGKGQPKGKKGKGKTGKA